MKSRAEGIVIYKQKIRDAMWLIKVLTLDHGLQSFWYRPKKGIRPLNALEEISFVSAGDQREQLHWMKEVEILVPHHQIESHPVKAATALFMQEILYRLLQENDPHPPLFYFLKEVIEQLEQEGDIALIHFVFLLGLMRSMGCCPVAPHDQPDWFGMRQGEFGRGTPPIEHIGKSNHQLEAWLALLKGDWAKLKEKPITNADRRMLLKSMVDYLFIHQHKVNEIQSLDIYYELFHA